jgi:uroporphyrin-III C-methyltransferase
MMARPILRGTVYLVGAGPGDPELITVRGLNLLRQADVVVHDRLVHPELLESASPRAHLIDVGKAPGRHTCSQDEINRILIQYARQGRAVVRLKGGDPFVFGRGGEECLALARAGVPYEVVPGISSAIAVPAYAGIPLTHRGVAGQFTVVTGHGGAVDWNSLPAEGTLVILMGVERLGEIAAALVERGRAAGTPVAVIFTGTTHAQHVVDGTLADIADRARGIAPPATIVVGPVAGLRAGIDWFDPSQLRPRTATLPGDAFSPLHQPVKVAA